MPEPEVWNLFFIGADGKTYQMYLRIPTRHAGPRNYFVVCDGKDEKGNPCSVR